MRNNYAELCVIMQLVVKDPAPARPPHRQARRQAWQGRSRQRREVLSRMPLAIKLVCLNRSVS
jgi:hypothetical protein